MNIAGPRFENFSFRSSFLFKESLLALVRNKEVYFIFKIIECAVRRIITHARLEERTDCYRYIHVYRDRTITFNIRKISNRIRPSNSFEDYRSSDRYNRSARHRGQTKWNLEIRKRTSRGDKG